MNGAIERVLPRWDQRERHSRWIDGPPERVWEALRDLRVRELPVTVALTRLRGGPAAWVGGVGEVGDLRVLDTMAVRELCADAPRELLLGDIARYTALRPVRPDLPRGDLAAFRSFREPGWTKVVMSFVLVSDRGGTRLTTETRVLATDPAGRRAFRWYWLLVRSGSAAIRREILRAVSARATEGTD